MTEILFVIIFIKIEFDILKYYFCNSIFTNIDNLKGFNRWDQFKLMEKLVCKCKNGNTDKIGATILIMIK